MNIKNDAIQHMTASRIYVRTAIWATKELVELVKADLAAEFTIRYNRRYLIDPRLFQNQAIFRQVQHEGMNIVLLQPEEKRLIDEQMPDKAIYLHDELDILGAQSLRKLLTMIINRFISVDESVGQDNDKTPDFLYYTNQLKKYDNSSTSRELLGEVLITSANGRKMWIAGLMELIGYCKQLFTPHVRGFDDCLCLEIPSFTLTNNVAISDIVEIPFSGSLSSSSFDILVTKLDQYMSITELISKSIIQYIDSEISISINPNGGEHQRKMTISPLTQAEAGQMYKVDERTIRNWEKNPNSAPQGYPGRTKRSEMELHAKIYTGEKIARETARKMNRRDLRDHNRQHDFPESSDPADIAAWYEAQKQRQTGKEPEK